MNKFKSLVLAAIGLLCSISVSAEDFTVGGIYYKITSSTNKTVAVTYRGSYGSSYPNEYSGAVTIPESVTYSGNTYSVTSIGDVAFSACSRLTSVVIPNSVTSIGDEAFCYCSSLTSVEIPNNVTSIGSSAFYECSSLTSVVIGNSVTSIGEFAFKGIAWYENQPGGVVYLGNYLLGYKGTMPSNTSVKIKEGTVLIAGDAFYACSSLTSVEIPNSVTSIGKYAFIGCSGLTSIVVEDGNSVYDSREGSNAIIESSTNTLIVGCKNTIIPNSVTSIGDVAFSACSGLTSVEIPNSVTSIGEFAFANCSGLTSVEIPNSVTSIGFRAFSLCSGLTSVEIPNSVTSIGEQVFSHCSGLTSVKIPNSVTSIGDDAFSWCTDLTSVEIPNSVTSIGDGAFSRCTDLTSVEIPNSVTNIGDRAFHDCSSLTSVVIPNSVTSIGEWAFMNCGGLINIVVEDGNCVYDSREGCNAIIVSSTNTLIRGCENTIIPNSVTSIGEWAFNGCSSLTSLEIPNSVTSIGHYAFYDCNNLKSITSLNPTPPATSNSSPFSNYDATLYVPFDAKDAYSEAEYWKEFTNIEELAPSHYELTDGVAYDRTSNCFVNSVTYTRTLPNLHWNALYVPFELPYDVIAEHYDVAYINDVNGYDTDDNGTIDDLAMEIIKIKGGTLKANYPYLIKAKTAADKAMSITVENATLYAAEENSVDCSSVYQNYAVTGIYTKKTAEELAGKLAISTSGAWQPLAAGTALNPFRLYLSIENRDNSPLKVEASAVSRMRIVERGETTGVETITPAQQREDVVIDLSGRRVKQPVKGGVYIVNGKKRIF